MSKPYDAIVVGARCAGSPTAMLLARRGLRVALVDRATFPSDTTSTHLIHPPGIASLERWGLLDAVIATGSPPIDTYAVDFGRTAVRGYFRKPFGPGWALVGDAGCNKDFITAQGIHDAFRDAELCATAVDDALEGRRSFESVLGEYQRRRDERVLPMYEFTAELAALTPPPPAMEQLLGAVSSSQESMDGFARVAAGVTSPAEFFSDENAQRMLAAAA